MPARGSGSGCSIDAGGRAAPRAGIVRGGAAPRVQAAASRQGAPRARAAAPPRTGFFYRPFLSRRFYGIQFYGFRVLV
jgi:hypothetical protein